MYTLIAVALVLIAIWAVVTIFFEAVGFLANLLLVAAIIALAVWAIRRLR